MRFAAFTGAVLACASASAQAATITQTFQFSGAGPNSGSISQVAPFDSSLGTLTGISATASVALSNDYLIAPIAGPDYITYAFRDLAYVHLYVADQNSTVLMAGGDAPPAGMGIDYYGPAEPFIDHEHAFTGGDGQISTSTLLAPSLSYFFWAYTEPSYYGSGYTSTSLSNNTPIAVFTLTYIFDPVPEPSIWAMMLLGFGAIGWRRRIYPHQPVKIGKGGAPN